MTRAAVFVTARTGSTRLPNKALLEVSPGVRSIEFLFQRLTNVTATDVTVLATTELPEDDILCSIAAEYGVRVYRGSVHDKLERWRGAAEEFGISVFATADGDDLLCDPGLIDHAIGVMRSDPAIDFLECAEVPCGAFTYSIRTTALNRVCEMKKSTDTEMMWVYFKDTGVFTLYSMPAPSADLVRPDYRLTLDYPEDLEFFKRVIEHFEGRSNVSMSEVVAFLDKHPEIRAINSFRQEDFVANQIRRTHLEV